MSASISPTKSVLLLVVPLPSECGVVLTGQVSGFPAFTDNFMVSVLKGVHCLWHMVESQTELVFQVALCHNEKHQSEEDL